MARQRLVESYSVKKSDLKPIKLNESNNKMLYEAKEYTAVEAYKFPQWVLDVKNKNGRVYSTELAKKVVKENIISFGLMDHPSEKAEQEEGSTKDIWCIEKDPVIEDGILWFSVFLVGEYGKGLVKDILDLGEGIPLSSSGYGEVDRSGNVDVDTYSIERYADFVLSPSFSIYGFKDYTENNPVRESVDPSALSIGSKIKYDDTYWKIEKIDGPDSIQVRKSNEDSIFKIISAKEIQEVMNEKKINEDNTSKCPICGDPVSLTGGNYKSLGGAYVHNECFEKESNTDKKQQEGKSMKTYSVEEKSFRLNIKNLIKEAESKQDLEEKLASYNEILTWFGEEFKAPDLQDEVSKKVEDINLKIKEFAKKGQRTDSLEETTRKLKTALSEVNSFNKKLSEKYEIAAEMLDNLKTCYIKTRELYENQKAKANGMVSATQYKEALDAVDTLKGKIKEARQIIKTLKEENEETKKELDALKKEEAEEDKMEDLKAAQKKAQEAFQAEKDAEDKAKQEEAEEAQKAEDEKKKAEESFNFHPEKPMIEDYYNDLSGYNPGYAQFKEEILGCKTLFEAQKYVIKIKEMVEGVRFPTQNDEFEHSLKLKEDYEKGISNERSIKNLLRKNYF